MVQIKNEKAKLLKYATLPIQVQERSKDAPATRAPISNFLYTQDANKLMFVNTSTIDETLINKAKTFVWDFGDKQSSKEESPTHVYKIKGNYITRLKISDSSGLSHEKQMLIEVKTIDPKYPITEVGTSTKTDIKTPVQTTKPIQSTSIKTINASTKSAFVTIGIIFLALLGFLGGGFLIYLFIQKIKHPDYSFGEIIEEEKEKMLSILEGRPYEAPSGEILSTGKGIKDDIQGILKESDTATKIKNDLINEKIPKSETMEVKVEPIPFPETGLDAPITETSIIDESAKPAWMQDIQESGETLNPVTTEESILDDDTPDWMKDIPEDTTNLTSPTETTEEQAVEPEPVMDVINSPQSVQPILPVPPMPLVPLSPLNTGVNFTQPNSVDDDDDIPDWLK